MALSYTAYTGNGTLKDFPISFDYIDKSHISVTVESQAVAFTVDTINKVVRLTTAPADGSRVLVSRKTPITHSYSDFSRGNAFGQTNVNNSFLWQLMISQEIAEGRHELSHVMLEDLNMGFNQIINTKAAANSDDVPNLGQVRTLIEEAAADPLYSWDQVSEWSTNPIVTEPNQLIPYANTNQLFRPLSLPYQVDSAAHPNPNDLLPDPIIGYAGELADVSKFIDEGHLSDYTDLVFNSINSMTSHANHAVGNIYRVYDNGEITDYEVASSGQVDLGNGLFAKTLEPSSDTNFSKFTRDSRSLIISSPVKNTAIKTILATVPRGGQNEAQLTATHGYTLMFHQGIAHDETTGEYFVTYFGQGGADSLKTTWVDVYDSDWNYSGKTFGIRCAFAEGLVVGYVNGVRKFGHYKYSMADGLNVTVIPETSSIVNLGIIEPSFQSTIKATSQVSSIGSKAAIQSPLGSSQGGFKYGLIRLYDVADLLTNQNPTTLNTVYIDESVIGGGSSDFTVTKPQSFCLTDYGFIFYSGYQYTSGAVVKNGYHHRVSQFGSTGELVSSVSYDPVVIDEVLTSEGFTPTIMEPEGICFDGSHLITSTVVGTDVIICSEGEVVEGKTVLNYSKAASHVASTGSQLNRVAMTRGISTIDSVALTTGDLMADYLQKASLSNLSIQLKPDAALQIGVHSFTNGLAECTNIDGNFVQIEIKANTGNYTFTASGSSPRNFVRRAEVIGGNNVSDTHELGSVVQRVASNFGQDRYLVKDSNNHTAIVFANETNGVIGSITMSSNETMFNKTSDERLKNPHGKIDGVLDMITQMSQEGAFQNAAFKSDPENIYPMFMAQTLAKYLPKAVTLGSGELGKEEFFPNTVDYSAVTPLIMMALAELIEEVKELKGSKLA